ncbi:SHOCT domain-containing protein [Paenibacillus koleovorans]|uniref:SHOCT domain-containing protein n=1 Tax=Paenibacillus koleovorans TaxID=121608 RepID=UPI000FD7A171|nr:SHOCT domain-containing protein [Paenibacillus koleovorans]
MFVRGRVKPSKGASLLGMIVGGIFVIIGITTILPMRAFGWFGVLWLLVAIGITIMHAVNFFSARGVPQWEVDLDQRPEREPFREDVESRLRRLGRMRQDRLITDEEYERKRAEIMSEKW